MSTLKVDTIQGKTTAGTLTLPAGHVRQVVHSKRAHGDGQISFATGNYSTFSDAPGMSVDITPLNSSSKFLIRLAFRYGSTASSDNVVRIVRTVSSTATNLYPVENASTGGAGGLGNIYYSSGNSSAQYAHIAFNDTSFDYLDEPSTTASINYKVQFSNANGTLRIGSRADAANDRDSSITVMEIIG
tara:strand:- start:3072 stop:3632 length:561 start_codon:yes stop_codon:yes gene_type:complete